MLYVFFLRRYRGRKKTYNNQYLGPCIGHEMNRCIACYRCVRFYNDYAGGKDLTVLASRENVYFGRHEEGCLESVFSGNLVEVCPTGVFTDKTLARSYTRKWDLQSAPSICDGCSVGCNTAPGERYGKIKRVINRYNPDVNGYFICDRGRFGYDHNNHPDRICIAEKRRGGDALEAVGYGDAIEAARDSIVAAQGKVIGIGSPRASVEENFALQKLVGAENFCAGVSAAQHEMLGEIVNIYGDDRVHCPSLREIEDCDAVLILGEDLMHTAARMALSVRQATRNLSFELATKSQIPLWQDEAVRTLAQDQRSPLIIASVAGTGLDEIASDTFNGSPAAIANFALAIASRIDADIASPANLGADTVKQAQRAADVLSEAKNPLIISGTGLNSLAVVRAAAQVAVALSARRPSQPAKGSPGVGNLCYVLPEANSMGLALLTEASTLRADQLLQKINEQAGEYTLIVLQNDIYQWLGANVADRLFNAVKNCVVIDQHPSDTSRQADVLIPAKTVAETEGTLVNYEGRAQRYFEVYEPDSLELKDNWHTLVNIARSLCNAGEQHTLVDTDAVLQLAEVNNFDDLVHLVEARGGVFSQWSKVAPDHEFRVAGMKAPRQPHRYSGRTSINANKKVAENQRPEDPDSALTFSMEGAPLNVPSSLNALVWSPGWNSNEAINKFQDEIGGAWRGGNAGLRVLEQKARTTINSISAVASDNELPEEQLLAVPERRLFDSNALAVLSSALLQRSAGRSLQMNSITARRIHVEAGAPLTIRINDSELKLPVLIDDRVPDSVVTVPDDVATRIYLPSALLPAVVEVVGA